ncbi:Zn-dependent hydrolase [Peribacillus frigoritolerans]|uniref:Zn-dependent hydrolase n=1 Tax=Peribacillus frigoritolerans TaxID=450367 RepID=UPI003F7D67F0
MINSKRLLGHLAELSEIGKNDATDGITRFSYTDVEQEAVDLVTEYMRRAGLAVTVDEVGNVIGSTPGIGPAIVVGSHIDTVPEGGKFDGALGVLSAIEIAQTLNEQQVEQTKILKVVAFKDEEGSRFGFGMIGSRAMAGTLKESHLNVLDNDGISIAQAMQKSGFNPKTIDDAKREVMDVYVEMHIEQGKVLEKANLPVGIVSGIAGPLWLEITLDGISEHAGATPMNIRKDALAGASECMIEIETLMQSESTAVATVGKLNVYPNGTNVIPGKVVFTIDIRDIDEEHRNGLEKQIISIIQQVSQKRDLQWNIRELQRVKPVKADPALQQLLSEKIKEAGIEPLKLISGAGHDAMQFGDRCPITMLFVRSKDGISHNPLEYSSEEDIALATEVFYKFIYDLVRK